MEENKLGELLQVMIGSVHEIAMADNPKYVAVFESACEELDGAELIALGHGLREYLKNKNRRIRCKYE